jgi:hypothetical protein
MTNDKRFYSKIENIKDHGLELSEQDVLRIPRDRPQDSLGLQAQILSKTKNLKQTNSTITHSTKTPQHLNVFSWLRPVYLGSGLLAISLLFAASLWLPFTPKVEPVAANSIGPGMTFADLEFHDTLLVQDELLFGQL